MSCGSIFDKFYSQCRVLMDLQTYLDRGRGLPHSGYHGDQFHISNGDYDGILHDQLIPK